MVAAPGRVNLIGEHIDYNDGVVLPMAIERYVMIAAAPADDNARQYADVYSSDFHESRLIPLEVSAGSRVDGWGKYLQGVFSGFATRGVQVPPFDAVIESNIPLGGGLSSSAALEVAMATLVEGLTSVTLPLLDKVLLCQHAEHEFAGVPCGIMDQYSSVFGKPDHLMLIDCQTEECERVPFDSSEFSVLITDSNVKHKLDGGEYALRRAQCESALDKLKKISWRDVSIAEIESKADKLSDVEFRRARHVVMEIERTLQSADAIRSGDWETVGNLMTASHNSLRDDFEVSCRELNVLVEAAQAIGKSGGVFGSRMTGGGFGGCSVTLVQNEHLRSVVALIKNRFQARTGTECTCFSTRPALGAHRLGNQAS